ncbi:MAG: class A beta-lactamase-related serine hydrolase [Gammaproteobacteria bacterium]|jgi:beta-lactamase class A
MCRTIAGSVFCLLASLLGLASLPATTDAADFYDVSYVWSRNIDGVRGYRKQVASVLGPAVAKDLKVVTRDSLIGLVYVRHGDSAGATRVAKSHTGLLRAKGLDAASPIRSENWTLVGEAGASSPAAGSPGVRMTKTSTAPPVIPLSRRSRMTSTERAREIQNLEAAVEDYINRLRKDGKLDPDERTGWSVYDFTTGEKLVTINEDQQFQAASLVKPFIAAAFFYKVGKGELSYNRESRRQMERMIQHSNNASTNWVTRKVGGPRAVQRILKQQYPAIFREIHLVEYIPAGGKTYRNKASVHDYSRFLYALWKEDIAGAREIKRLMALPGRDRIYTGVRGVPKGTRVYNKTGSTARVCGDMGILNVKGADGKWYPYTVIGIIEKEQGATNYTSWIRSRGNIIRHVSSIVYRGIAQNHNI